MPVFVETTKPMFNNPTHQKILRKPLKRSFLAIVAMIGAFVLMTLASPTAQAAKFISVGGSLNFGTVQIGASSNLTMFITNSGGNTLNVTGITLPAGFTTTFTGASVHSGTTQPVVITFAPTNSGTFSGTVTVTSDGTGPNTLPISGIGAGQVVNVTGNLSFGNVPVNTSAQLSLNISNSGTTNLTVSSITYPNGFSGAFSGVIVPGASTNVTVTFSPTAVTNYSGTVTVNSDSLFGTNTLAASGAGTAATIVLSGNLSFGSVPINTSVQHTLIISKTGSATLNVSSISYPTGFSGSFSGAIAAGKSTNVTVTFTPTTTGALGGTITVNSDAFSGVNTITASGAGIASAIALSGDLNFPGVMVGSSSQLTLTITNTGGVTLNVGSITFPAQFGGSFSGAIAPGARTNVTVTFSPTNSGAINGVITVNSDAFSGANTVNASGTGIAQTRIVSLSGDLNFNPIFVGTTEQLVLTITNSGNSTLTISNITFPAGFSGDITNGALAPNTTTNVTVTFAPTDSILYSGPIMIISDATSGVNSVNASGTGIALSRIVSLSADLNFNPILVGTTEQLVLTITNTGNSTMTISNVTFPPGFSCDISNAVLVPNATTNVTVTFAPTDSILYIGQITILSDATSGVNTANVSGQGVALTRIISLSGDLNFSPVLVNSSSQLVLTITNSGNSVMTISSISFPAGLNGDITSGALVPGATTNVTVTFSPTDSILYSGQITVNSDATSGVNSVNVSGQGEALTANISLSGDLNFGSIFVGDSSSQDLIVSNSGTRDLTFTNIELPAGFTADITNGEIAPNTTTNITITFSPTDTISYDGTLTVDSDATGGSNTVNVTGSGTAVPTKTISFGGDVNFGNVPVGQSEQITLTITNTGNSTLTITSIDLPPGFSGSFSGSLNPGDTADITITFTPTDTNTFSGVITINSDATGPDTVNVSGTGIPATQVISIGGSGGDLNFGDVRVGWSAQLPLIITNTGNSDLTITNVEVPNGFTVDITNAVLVPGAGTNFTITFTPTNAADYSGPITIDSDANGGTNSVNASGTGTLAVVPSRIIVLSGNLNFGDVQVGALPTATLTISNAGNSTMTVSNISYPNGFSGAFSGTIAAGAVQNVTVTFTPAVNQPFSGVVVVASDATFGTNSINASGDAFNYVAAKVKVSGLFYPSNDVEFANSGYFGAKASTRSALSVKVRIGGRNYAAAGRFSNTGSFSHVIKRKGLTPLTITLQAGFNGGLVWKGTVSDGTFTATLHGDVAAFTKSKKHHLGNVDADAGTYTITITGSEDSSVAPTANGTGTVTVTSLGIVKITATLGDGSKLVQATTESQFGQIPLYGALYSHKGSILGWLSFGGAPGDELNGTVDWFKSAGIDSNFPSGFAFETSLAGAKH